MINKLKKLGEYVQKNDGDSNPMGLNITLETGNVIVLDFTIDDEACNFEGIDTIEFDAIKRRQFLYKNVKGNAVSPFPTIFVDKTNVVNSLDKLLRIIARCKDDNQMLLPLFDNFKLLLFDFLQKFLFLPETYLHPGNERHTAGPLFLHGDFFKRL